jgi:molybdate transport system substrate-binding protein
MVMKYLCRLCLLVMVSLMVMAMPVRAEEINLFAAASMRDTVDALCDAFAEINPGIAFQKNYGASGILAKQIENGAPADVYISANTKWMDYLKGKKMVNAASIAVIAYNELVFVGMPELKVSALQDIVTLERIAIGSPMSVPAGQYAMEAIKNSGLDQPLRGRLVMARDVRECLMYAERAEVEGAFVYMTDAQQMAKKTRVFFVVPQELYSRVTYPAALTASGSAQPQAAAFLKYLRSPAAQKIFALFGFTEN